MYVPLMPACFFTSGSRSHSASEHSDVMLLCVVELESFSEFVRAAVASTRRRQRRRVLPTLGTGRQRAPAAHGLRLGLGRLRRLRGARGRLLQLEVLLRRHVGADGRAVGRARLVDDGAGVAGVAVLHQGLRARAHGHGAAALLLLLVGHEGRALELLRRHVVRHLWEEAYALTVLIMVLNRTFEYPTLETMEPPYAPSGQS